jgi:hypothetical protein
MSRSIRNRDYEQDWDASRRNGTSGTSGRVSGGSSEEFQHRRGAGTRSSKRPDSTVERSFELNDLAQIIDSVAAERPTAPEFVAKLAERGVTVIPSMQSSGRLNGFSFRWKGETVRGSAIGREYSAKGLQKKGVGYEASRDAALLIAAAERAGVARVSLDIPHEDRRLEGDIGRAGRLRDFRTGLNDEQKAMLAEVGRFRTVNAEDIIQHKYDGRETAFKQDLRNLRNLGLVDQRTVKHGRSGRQFTVLVLTRRGRKQAERVQAGDHAGGGPQEFYAGFVKPNEVPHDAGIYRMYQVEAARIEGEGGKIHRVVLDYELKRKVFSKLNAESGHSRTDYSARKQQIASENGLQVVNGRIQFPDLRIEFETRDQELDKVDLELATGDYKSSEVQAKQAAGFKIYGSGGPALYAPDSRPRSAALEDPEIIAGLIAI